MPKATRRNRDGRISSAAEANPVLKDMNKIIFLILLAVGVVLIIKGVHASDSVSSDFSRFFHGTPTDRTVWLMIGGSVLAVIGAGGLARGPRSL